MGKTFGLQFVLPVKTEPKASISVQKPVYSLTGEKERYHFTTDTYYKGRISEDSLHVKDERDRLEMKPLSAKLNEIPKA